MTFLIISILLLSAGMVILLTILRILLIKYKHIDKKDKEFIVFVIDMYIAYAKELNIHSEEQHDEIIKRLENIKKNYFYTENKESILKKQ